MYVYILHHLLEDRLGPVWTVQNPLEFSRVSAGGEVVAQITGQFRFTVDGATSAQVAMAMDPTGWDPSAGAMFCWRK